MSTTNALDIVAPEDMGAAPPVGDATEVTAPKSPGAPEIGSAPSGGPLEVVPPAGIDNPSVPPIGGNTPEAVGEVAPPVGWDPGTGNGEIDAFACDLANPHHCSDPANAAPASIDQVQNETEDDQCDDIGGCDDDDEDDDKKVNNLINEIIDTGDPAAIAAMEDYLREKAGEVFGDSVDPAEIEKFIVATRLTAKDTADLAIAYEMMAEDLQKWERVKGTVSPDYFNRHHRDKGFIMAVDQAVFSAMREMDPDYDAIHWDAVRNSTLVVLRTAADFTPIGYGLGVGEAVVGYDVMGNKLAIWEQAMAVVPMGKVAGVASDALGMAKNVSKGGRARHYTNRRGINGIEKDMEIGASSRQWESGCVFCEPANKRPLSPTDAEARYGLNPGKGRDYVEFDVDTIEMREVKNPLTGKREWVIDGNVNLNGRNPEFTRRR